MDPVSNGSAPKLLAIAEGSLVNKLKTTKDGGREKIIIIAVSSAIDSG